MDTNEGRKFTNCPNCGAPIREDLNECPYCGTPYQKMIRIPVFGEMQDIVFQYGDDRVAMRGYIANMTVKYMACGASAVRGIDGRIKIVKNSTKREITVTLIEE